MIQLRSNSHRTGLSATLSVSIETALCVGAGSTTGTLADKPIVRTATGRLLIPGSQVKGRLRHECEKLLRGLHWPTCESPMAETMCPERAGIIGDFERPNYQLTRVPSDKAAAPTYHCFACQLFGNPSLPSRIAFDDLVCETPSEQLPEVLRPGVTLSRERRTAADQRFFLLETSPANTGLVFSGEVEFLPDCPEYGPALVKAALRHVHALGGSKSAGLGWLSAYLDIADTALTIASLMPPTGGQNND